MLKGTRNKQHQRLRDQFRVAPLSLQILTEFNDGGGAGGDDDDESNSSSYQKWQQHINPN
jgi:hypothetical protein